MGDGSDFKEKVQKISDVMHGSLKDLKENYGQDFSGKQKEILNKVAKGNNQLRKLLRGE